MHNKKYIYFALHHKTKAVNFFVLQPKILLKIEAVTLKGLLKLMCFKSPEKIINKSKHNTIEQLAKVLSQLAKQSSLSDTTDMGRKGKNAN